MSAHQKLTPQSAQDVTAKAAKFFEAAIEHMQEGYDWDGCDLQDTCKNLGLTEERLYDPETDFAMDASEGEMVWVPTTAGQALLRIARGQVQS